MSKLIEIIKALLSAWFYEKRKDTNISKLYADLRTKEKEYARTKELRTRAVLAGNAIDVIGYDKLCAELSHDIDDLRRAIGSV